MLVTLPSEDIQRYDDDDDDDTVQIKRGGKQFKVTVQLHPAHQPKVTEKPVRGVYIQPPARTVHPVQLPTRKGTVKRGDKQPEPKVKRGCSVEWSRVE